MTFRHGIPTLVFSLVLVAASAFGQGTTSSSGGSSVDGIVSPGEYPGMATFTDGDYIIHWLVVEETIRFAIDAVSEGWVAIGFDPASVMDQADMVFGLVPQVGSAEPVSALDTFSEGMFGPHPLDEAIGGSDDITAFAGSRSGGRLVFEFERNLQTGDSRDKPIPSDSSISIIWAMGSGLDFESMHVRAGSGLLDVAAGSGSRTSSAAAPLLILHITLMSISFLSMFAGLIFARYFKTRKFWLKVHRPLGAGGAISGILGVLAAASMIQISGGEHIGVPHAVAGLAVILLCAAMPVLGFGIFKYKGDKKKIKKLHRILGRITILAMAGVILSGLVTAGII